MHIGASQTILYTTATSLYLRPKAIHERPTYGPLKRQFVGQGAESYVQRLHHVGEMLWSYLSATEAHRRVGKGEPRALRYNGSHREKYTVAAVDGRVITELPMVFSEKVILPDFH